MIKRLQLRQPEGWAEVELHLSRSTTTYKSNARKRQRRWFIDVHVFDLFSPCFENNVAYDNQFNRYGPTKFRRHELIKVRSCLGEVESSLQSIGSLAGFEARLLPFLSFDPPTQTEIEDNWQTMLQDLKNLNLALIQLASRVIREGWTLWVLGP